MVAGNLSFQSGILHSRNNLSVNFIFKIKILSFGKCDFFSCKEHPCTSVMNILKNITTMTLK